MRVVVTGANGYIGMHVVRALLRRNIDVIAWDIATDRIPPGVTCLREDLFSAKEFPECDVLLHLAWRDGFKHNAPSHALDLSQHFSFIRRILSSTKCRHVAVMGTMHEIGYHTGMITETTPCSPTTLYAIAKHSLRQLLQNWMPTEFPEATLQWLRTFYLYGDDVHNHSVFTKILQADVNGQKTFPFVTGNNAYDFLDIYTLADMIVATISQTEIAGIIHLCSGKAVSLRERAESFIKENGLSIRLQLGVYPDRPYDSPCSYGDPTKINAILRAQK